MLAGSRARDGRARSRSAVLSGAPGGSRARVFRSQRHQDRAVACRCDVPLRLGHRPAHPARPSSEQHHARRARPGEREPLQRVHALQPVSDCHRRRALRGWLNPSRSLVARSSRRRCDIRDATTPIAPLRRRHHNARRTRANCRSPARNASSHRSLVAPIAHVTVLAARRHRPHRDAPVAPMYAQPRPSPTATSPTAPRCSKHACRTCQLPSHPMHPLPHRNATDRHARCDCGQTDHAVGELERQVFGGAPAGTRRVAHRDRCGPWRARSRRLGVRHFRSGARARRHAAAREAASAAAGRRGRADAADERISSRSKSGRRSPTANRRICFFRCTPTPAPTPPRSGVETYFLNFALNPQAEAVAARENAASGKTMSSLPSIIKAITLNSKLNESRDFAASIQRSLVRGMRPGNKTLRDLGVKQAPFMVLIGAAMPSVLAEISFVTNPQEARLLKTARLPPAHCGIAAGGDSSVSAVAQEGADGGAEVMPKTRIYNLESGNFTLRLPACFLRPRSANSANQFARAVCSEAVRIAQSSFASARSALSAAILPFSINSSHPSASSISSTAIPSFEMKSGRDRPRFDDR